VPCTTMVKRTVCEQVPYTVVKKVPYTIHKQVPCTVTRMVPETIVKQVPYTTTRYETQVVRTQVPYTVTRCLRGAYVDQCPQGGQPAPAPAANGCGTGAGDCGGNMNHDCPGPGREFVEGAQVCRTYTTTTTRMVPQTETRKVQYTVWKTVSEEH